MSTTASRETNGSGRWPPWSRMQALNELTEEAGIDFDQFIESIKNQASIAEMAEQFQVSPDTIANLQEHFFRYGIGSVEGGD
ncbi:MAG: helix-turn-helix domain-containing protein [Syntrophomonadaceae bacterium]